MESLVCYSNSNDIVINFFIRANLSILALGLIEQQVRVQKMPWLIWFVKRRLRGIQLRSDYIESWVSYLNSSIMWHCVTIKRRSKASSSNRRLRLFFLIADQIDNQFFVSSQLCVTHRSIALHLWRQIWPTFHLFHFSDFFFLFLQKAGSKWNKTEKPFNLAKIYTTT